jgi:hypothetical protein
MYIWRQHNETPCTVWKGGEEEKWAYNGGVNLFKGHNEIPLCY